MLKPGTSDIAAVVGSYSAIHISEDRVHLSHICCISERANRKKAVTVFGTVTQKPRVFVPVGLCNYVDRIDSKIEIDNRWLLL